MARPPQQDEQQSDSVMIQQFAGIRNTVSRERLGPTDLEKAQNIDLDDVGQARRRRGYTLVAAGNYHSMHRAEDRVFVVKDGTLGILYPDYSFEALRAGMGQDKILYPDYSFEALRAGMGQDKMAYAHVGGVTYYSSRVASGKVLEDKTNASWGFSDSAGEWISPVLNPTSTLSPIHGKVLSAPPIAEHLAYYSGRIYLAEGRTVWATELWQYDYIQTTKNFMQFEYDVTGLGVVQDGIYVGTTGGVWFLNGPGLGNFELVHISHEPLIPGSIVVVPADLVRPDRNRSRQAILYMTNEGLYTGLDSGVAYNLTEDRVVFPEAASVAAMYRHQDGINQYVGVADAGGTPASKARIGDYVDAEIRRFQAAPLRARSSAAEK